MRPGTARAAQAAVQGTSWRLAHTHTPVRTTSPLCALDTDARARTHADGAHGAECVFRVCSEGGKLQASRLKQLSVDGRQCHIDESARSPGDNTDHTRLGRACSPCHNRCTYLLRSWAQEATPGHTDERALKVDRHNTPDPDGGPVKTLAGPHIHTHERDQSRNNIRHVPRGWYDMGRSNAHARMRRARYISRQKVGPRESENARQNSSAGPQHLWRHFRVGSEQNSAAECEGVVAVKSID
uniref:Uncharacterized protein n=1 Tax=Eutreptiella gymnastica TaxID=73025 RepID=A0A6T2IXV5_9EUGL|mmetsp:Transcript_33528/g.56112  ORF Transcript_33528/g.56112 Transcript_33528/m.56112 type:complete len:241 (-) Transcript_33528:174-896(-)